MTLPGETEAGSAGMQPCRGITWWAHRDDDRSAEPSRPRSSNNHIGSVDPDALKIPAPKGRNTNQQWDASPPFHAEPEQCRSFSAMIWSSISRRQLPTQRSPVPFCQGDRMLVRFGFRPVAFRNVITVASNCVSRSRIT